jgi:hypothetical protein
LAVHGHPLPYAHEDKLSHDGNDVQNPLGQGSLFTRQARISWGVEGSSYLSLGPTISYHSMPYVRPTPCQPHGHQGVGRPQGEFRIFVFGPPPTPHETCCLLPVACCPEASGRTRARCGLGAWSTTSKKGTVDRYLGQNWDKTGRVFQVSTNPTCSVCPTGGQP